ncbi:cytochrome P450 [Lactarius psammicola]|nr:cytochrome P450 [Lactarius psammicola]
MFSLFKIFAYALVALAGVALLAVLKHRIRQRSLQRIPGPSNPSLFWGKLRRTYGKVTRVYGFLGLRGPILNVITGNRTSSSWYLTQWHATTLLSKIKPFRTNRGYPPLCENFRSTVSNGPEEIDIADWMGKLALELIGQAGLGYSFGTLEGRDDEFCIPPQNSQVPGECVTVAEIDHLMDIAETLDSKSRGIHETKKKLLELGDDATVRQVGDGNDIISILMRASVTGPEDDRLSDEDWFPKWRTPQPATNTTTTALSRILHLLALHPDVQDRLRKELKEAHEDNEELTHDQLVSLPFMEADVDGCKVHEIFVPKNTNVFVQIYHLNRDPSIWGTDAAEWKPERWLAPLPQSVADAKIQGVYANTMTFIGGSRACMSWADSATFSGFKFSQLEMSKRKRDAWHRY